MIGRGQVRVGEHGERAAEGQGRDGVQAGQRCQEVEKWVDWSRRSFQWDEVYTPHAREQERAFLKVRIMSFSHLWLCFKGS